MGSVRTFIAFAASDEARDMMKNVQSELRKSNADVRWEPADKFHATVKFLGNVDEGKMPEVVNRVKRSASQVGSFEVVYASLGVFPDKRRPRVVWIGCLNADGQLQKLKDGLDAELSAIGFEIDVRTFRPHITLGRVRSDRGIGDLLSRVENINFDPQRTKVDSLLVVKSTLKPEGSEYSIVTSIPLT